MKRNDLSHFFYGCIAGALLSSTLFFVTHYAKDLRLVIPSQSLFFKRTTFLLPIREALQFENEWEQKSRNLLLPVVVSSLSQAASTYRKVQKTWGQTVEKWIIAVGTAGGKYEWRKDGEGLQDHLLMANKCLDFSHDNHLSLQSMFCLVSAIHKAYPHQYNWFVIIPSTTYLAINRLNIFLAKLDPQEPLYIGNPSSSSSKERSSFTCDGSTTHCSMENGVIMSRAALHGIAPHLSWCSQDKSITSEPIDRREIGVEMKNGDIALGCCMKKVLDISCSDSILTSQVNLSALFLSNPTNIWLQEQFLSLGPISNLHDMLAVYLHTLSMEMWDHVSKANRYAHLARQGCLQLPESNSCNFTPIAENSFVLQGLMSNFMPHRASHKDLWDLVNWETVRNSSKFNSYMLNPSTSLSKSSKLELQYILMKALNFIGRYVQGLSLVYMKNAYLRYSGSNGREYVLDLEMKRNGEKKREIWRCNLLFSPTSGMIFINTINTQTIDMQLIEFIVPLSNVKNRLSKFLKMYENLCLKTKEACSLNLVVFGKSDTEYTSKLLNILKKIYPEAKLNVTRGIGKFSRGRALDLGMEKLTNSSLMFLCDVDMVIKRDFLKSCQRNTIRDKQVYYPEFFKYYNMDYVYHFSRKTKGMPAIDRRHGHWATYSYGMLCLYKSDYISVGGFDLSIEGWGGEDVSLAKSILKKKLEIFRAPEPSLLHQYHDKVCNKDLTALQFAQCISSRNEDIADRSQLAEYVFYLENKYKIKQWKLWGP